MSGALDHDAPRTRPMSTQGAINMVTLLALAILGGCIAHSLITFELLAAAKFFGGMAITEVVWMAVSLLIDDENPSS